MSYPCPDGTPRSDTRSHGPIYGSSTFWHYAAADRILPIHVLVRHGHVTLTGIVDNGTERAMAGVLASQFSAVSLTNNLRVEQ